MITWLYNTSQKRSLSSGYIYVRVRAEVKMRLLISARVQKKGKTVRGPRLTRTRAVKFKGGETRTVRLRVVDRGRRVLKNCVGSYLTIRIRWQQRVFSTGRQNMRVDHPICKASPAFVSTPNSEGEGTGNEPTGGSDPDAPTTESQPPSPQGNPRPARTLFGLHQELITSSMPDRMASMDKAANYFHAEISRSRVPWYLIERTEGVLDWAATDQVVNTLSASDIEPLLVLFGSPRWANGAPDYDGAGFWVPRPGPAFDRWADRYAVFAKQAARRYKDRVHRWEVWNEENQGSTWQGTPPSPEQYKKLFVKVQNAILSEDPTAQVAIGGLGGVSYSGPGTYSGIDFIKELHRIGLDFDYVSIHPYAHRNQAPDDHIPYENNFSDIGLIHDYLQSVGSKARIWVTEFGWDSSKLGDEQQAVYLKRALQIIRTRYGFLDMALVFVDRDLPPRWNQGLMTETFQPKPAAGVYRDFLLGLPR